MTTTEAITPDEAQRLLAAGKALLVDVREPEEFRGAHIPYAASIPLAQVTAVIGGMRLPDDVTLIFQCQKGARGERACAAVPPSQASRVRNLAGGIEAWQGAGLPVTGVATSAVSIFRQVQTIVGSLVFGFTLVGLAGFAPAFYLAGFFGFMLAFAVFSGWCGLAVLLQRMPWNRPAPA